MPVLFTFLIVPACASTQGSHPHDMSTTGHEAAAAAEDREAAAHQAQYVPDASVDSQKCEPVGATKLEADSGVCWTSRTNPTDVHLAEAAKHRKMAADHRGGSQALRDAEKRACVGVPDDDRDESPFDHREDITGVEPLTSGSTPTTTSGAVVTFRAVPGMTVQWLQRVVDCHLARNSAVGFEVPEMPYCPLVPKGITARVAAAGAGFSVSIRSDDPKTADEVLRRARSLLPKR